MENKRVLTPEEESKIKNFKPMFLRKAIRIQMLRNPKNSFETVAKDVDELSAIHGF